MNNTIEYKAGLELYYIIKLIVWQFDYQLICSHLFWKLIFVKIDNKIMILLLLLVIQSGLLLTGIVQSLAPWRNLVFWSRNYRQHYVARRICPTPQYLMGCLESLDWKWDPLFYSQGCLAKLRGLHQRMDHLEKKNQKWLRTIYVLQK